MHYVIRCASFAAVVLLALCSSADAIFETRDAEVAGGQDCRHHFGSRRSIHLCKGRAHRSG